MKKMIALVRQLYEAKHISAGDIFNVRDEHVILLKALGRVKDMPVVKAMSAENTPELIPTLMRGHAQTQRVAEAVSETIVAPHAATQQTVETVSEGDKERLSASWDDRVTAEQSIEFSRMLRERATALGIHVDGRWSDSRVQREIDEHNKRTYERMDMRPTE